MGILDEKGILAENEIYVQPRRGSPPLQGNPVRRIVARS